ncbi:MAG: PQQ-binding-like beta-propeller repeat protein, partial [Candidatus Bathyarchaeia archaeon]
VQGFIYSLSTSSDGGVAAAGGSDAYVYCFNSKDGTLKWRYRAEGAIRSVSVSEDGKHVLAGGYDGGVYMLEADSGKLVWNHWIKGKVKAVHLSPRGNMAFAGGDDGNFYVFDVETGRLLELIESDSWVTSISSSLDGLRCVFGSGDKVYLVTLKPSLIEEREGFKPPFVYVFQLATPTALTIALALSLTWRGKSWRAKRN